jgi:serine/threonine-protein kinase
MAPEQAKGKVADKRADVWAFGVVLYEMLTGRRTFEGGDVSEVMAGVIKSEPEWDLLPAELSPALGTYLRRCLQKDPRERLRDIGDVRLAMSGALDATDTYANRQVSWYQRLRAILDR